MTFPRMLPWLVAAGATFASSVSFAGEPPAPAASASLAARSDEATKARQEADRQRLIAKLRAEAPKTTEKQRASVLDLPIFNRNNRP